MVHLGVLLVKGIQRSRFVCDGEEVATHVADILRAFPLDGQSWRVVGRAAHLVDIPVGGEVGEVAAARICAEAFHFLGVPEGEGVVVAVGIDNWRAFIGQGAEVVHAKVAAGVASGAVVVVPGLANHL